MAGRLTEEPRPREPASDWCAWAPTKATLRVLAEPDKPVGRSFDDVIVSRRSAVGHEVAWSEIESLLWHSSRTMRFLGLGRAGIPIEHRIAPSAGALHSVQIICQMMTEDLKPEAYLHTRHAMWVIDCDRSASEFNRREVLAVVGNTAAGCTLRLVADMAKIDAAYQNGESLVWRDAGIVSATVCMVAEWLGLRTNVLGFAGNGYLPLVGYPKNRFLAVGAVQVSK